MRSMGRVNIMSLMAMTDIKKLENRLAMQSLNPPGNMGNINLRHYHPRPLYKGIKQPPRYAARSGRRIGR